MSKPPAFQLYASDFYMDTAGWTAWEVGVYLRLLLYEWVNGGIPNDIESIARIVGEPIPAKTKRFNKRRGVILCEFEVKITCNTLKKFSLNSNGFLINSRLEEVREKQNEYREKQSISGSKGIEKKKKEGIYPFKKLSDPSSNPSSNPSSETQALQSSSSINKPPIVPLLKIPLIKKDGEFEITQKDIDGWQETFPGMDVLPCIRFIRQWNIDTPDRRKTRRGIRKHISGWLARDNDKGKWRKQSTCSPLQHKGNGKKVCKCGKPAEYQDEETEEWFCKECFGPATRPTEEFLNALSRVGRDMPDGEDPATRKEELLKQAESLPDDEIPY